MKTSENPTMKAREGRMTRPRDPALTSAARRSTDIPVMNEREDGKRGSTQGDRKDSSPAPNATATPRDSPRPTGTRSSASQERFDEGAGGLAVPLPGTQGQAHERAPLT